MKPDWKDAPEWANWLAMDGDGYWHWFACEPEWSADDGQWVMGEDSPVSAYLQASDLPDESGVDWDFAYSEKEARPNA